MSNQETGSHVELHDIKKEYVHFLSFSIISIGQHVACVKYKSAIRKFICLYIPERNGVSQATRCS